MTVACQFCGGQIDPLHPTTYRRVLGWERRAQSATRRGGSDITLRELREEFACDICIGRLKRGIAPTQEGLGV